jgi:hypothetical protein
MIQRFSKFLFVAAFAAILSSCGEDGIVTPVTKDPKISFGGTSGADAIVKPCEAITLNIVASKGDAEMNAIEVTEDGAKVAVDRLTWKGNAVGGNPILLVGADRTSIASDLIVKANCAVGIKSVTVTIIDASSVKASAVKKITTEAVSPSLAYIGPDPVEASPGVANLFKFDVTKGSGKIVSLEVQENSLKITDLTRLTFEGTAFTTNPESLIAAYQDGFAGKSVGVKTAATGTYKYTFIFTDEYGLKTEKEVNVKVGTPTTFMQIGALFNQAGPTGFGGLDLDTAQGTGSTSLSAEVADLGINANPLATNWKQEIKGVNGTELKILKKGAEVDIEFKLANVTLVDQITALHAKGKDIAAGQKIIKGDVVTAKKGTQYYIFEVTEVTLTLNDNADFYTVDIKY